MEGFYLSSNDGGMYDQALLDVSHSGQRSSLEGCWCILLLILVIMIILVVRDPEGSAPLAWIPFTLGIIEGIFGALLLLYHLR
jgi:hypothetical protein